MITSRSASPIFLLLPVLCGCAIAACAPTKQLRHATKPTTTSSSATASTSASTSASMTLATGSTTTSQTVAAPASAISCQARTIAPSAVCTTTDCATAAVQQLACDRKVHAQQLAVSTQGQRLVMLRGRAPQGQRYAVWASRDTDPGSLVAQLEQSAYASMAVSKSALHLGAVRNLPSTADTKPGRPPRQAVYYSKSLAALDGPLLQETVLAPIGRQGVGEIAFDASRGQPSFLLLQRGAVRPLQRSADGSWTPGPSWTATTVQAGAHLIYDPTGGAHLAFKTRSKHASTIAIVSGGKTMVAAERRTNRGSEFFQPLGVIETAAGHWRPLVPFHASGSANLLVPHGTQPADFTLVEIKGQGSHKCSLPEKRKRTCRSVKQSVAQLGVAITKDGSVWTSIALTTRKRHWEITPPPKVHCPLGAPCARPSPQERTINASTDHALLLVQIDRAKNKATLRWRLPFTHWPGRGNTLHARGKLLQLAVSEDDRTVRLLTIDPAALGSLTMPSKLKVTMTPFTRLEP